MAEWSNLEISTEPLVEKVQPPIDTMVSVLDYLITILSIAQKILNIVKAFLVGALDPIRATVETIISTIQDIISDLRQLGIYFTGDWVLIRGEDKHSNLIGGYQAYERRMLSRLLDTTDPDRPDFTSASSVLGVFFFVSSGDINEIIRLIRAILRFFGRGDLMGNSVPYGTPTVPEIKYGTDGAGVASFRQLGSLGEIPSAMTVTWSMPATAGGVGQAFSPAPKGFLIHVSTVPEGFKLVASVAVATSEKTENIPRKTIVAVDPLTNGVLKLHGGVADVQTGVTDFSDVEQTDDETAPRLFLLKDNNTPLIKPSTLIESDSPLIATTFFAKTGFVSKLGAGATFSATLPRSALPKHATFKAGSDGYAEVDGSSYEPTKYWIRVRAVTQDYLDYLAPGTRPRLSNPEDTFRSITPPYYFPPDSLNMAVGGILLPLSGSSADPGAGWMSMTSASGPALAEFPTSAQLSYISAVQAAIALAILCRADLTEGNYGRNVGVVGTIGTFKHHTYSAGEDLKGLENAGRDLMARYGVKRVFFRGTRPAKFRRRLRNVLVRVASDLTAKGPIPDSVAQNLETESQVLLEFLWSEIHADYPGLTILESLGFVGSDTATVYKSEDRGVGANPFCRMTSRRVLDERYTDIATSGDTFGGPLRGPSFDLRQSSLDGSTPWQAGEGSADYSPILFNDTTNRVEYIRNAVRDYSDGELLDAAVAVLQIASAWVSRPIGDAQWLAVRLMPQALAPLDELLEKLDRFLKGVLDGLEGVTDKIVAYIEAIQARIQQLQAILNYIRAVLNALDNIRIGPASTLVLLESGTDGLVSGLVSAENKPGDSPSSYGAGVAMVAGGLPSALIELLRLLFSGGE